LSGINITEFFRVFENFGQNIIGHHQISGTADAGIRFSALLRDDLSFDLNTVKSQIELEVVKGRLKDVEALADVAAYLRGNVVWSSLVRVDAFEKKLASVDFDTLRNTIEIKDRTVYIPAMRIGSSALTLHLSGQHDFDHNIDYHLNFRLNELFRPGKPSSDEFGYITDDGSGLRLFLRMAGTADDPEFSMDRQGARQKRKEEFQREKSTFKGMLKEEFGLFKSDTTLKSPPTDKNKNAPVFDVKWNEFDNSDSTKAKDSKPKKKRGLFAPKEDDGYDGLDGDDDL
ncbi:MAG: AsmA-like C-terminal region-containing protein, partial [Flavobacteriales bacterium]|nr:AsmA-like C-terminal region-containing protein [Flavobacteriales bacterium]